MDYGRTERAIIRLGYGFSRSRNGASSLHAVSCLPAVRGAWRHPGAGLYGSIGQTVSLNTSLVTGVDDPDVRQLDMSRLGPILTGEAEPLNGGPPVTAMLVQSSNPAVVAPESGKVRAGLTKDDMFLCVHEHFLTDTAKLADIVLPATTFLEHDDIYTSYGQPYLQMGAKILDPLGETRSNHDMIGGLARRLGAEHRAFEMDAWDVIDEILQTNGYGTAENLKQKRFIELRPSFEECHFLNGFPQPDGKFRFRADWAALGPDHAALPRSARFLRYRRRRGRGPPVPDGDRAVAQLPEHQLHRNRYLDRQRTSPDDPYQPGGLRRAGRRRRRPRPHRQRTRRSGAECRGIRRGGAGGSRSSRVSGPTTPSKRGSESIC